MVEKALISILVIAVILVVAAIVTACVLTFNNSSKNGSNGDDLEANMQNRLTPPKCALPKAPGIFATCEKSLICEDPLSEVVRICDSEINIKQRQGQECQFNFVKEIDDMLMKMLSNNRYEYQTDPWLTAFFWRKKESKPKYSIVVPVYNQEQIIKRTIRSIYENMIGDFEFIFIFDGCKDQSVVTAIDEFKSISNLNDKENPYCCAIIVVEIKQSVYETQCDNIGFKLSSSPTIIEIQADMKILEKGFNLVMEKPLLYFNDLIGISGLCTHFINIKNAIGFPFLLEGENDSTQWSDTNIIYLSSSVNRGPLLLDAAKLKKVGYLDEKNFTIENDEHDLFSRAWREHGYRTAFIKIGCKSEIADGSSRKIKPIDQQNILGTRRRGKRYDMPELPKFYVANFRKLDVPQFNAKYSSLVAKTFGEKINATLVQFGNSESIYFINAHVAHLAHTGYGFRFDKTFLYTEHHIQDYLKTLPPDLSIKNRGFYYWAFKPYIILETLKKLKENEILIYADGGLFFTNLNKIKGFVADAKRESYVFFENSHNNRTFTKPECLHLFKNQADLNAKMVDASLMFLKNTPIIRNLIQNWLNLCTTPFMLSDARLSLEKHKDFQEHRHDQSLLSSLIRNEHIYITPIFHHTDRTFTCHHRSRDLKSLKQTLQAIDLKQVVDLIF